MRFLNHVCRDFGLDRMRTTGIRLSLLSQAPGVSNNVPNFADIALYSLGATTLTPTSFTIGDNPTALGGRKISINQTTITPNANDAGASLHYVVDDGTIVLGVTEAPVKQIFSGNQETTAAFGWAINDYQAP